MVGEPLTLTVLVMTVPFGVLAAILTRNVRATGPAVLTGTCGQVRILVVASYAFAPQLLSKKVKSLSVLPVNESVIAILIVAVPLLIKFTLKTTVSPGANEDCCCTNE